MPAAPIPPNESERIEAVRAYGILDTEPEEAFDRLARLAAELMGTPIAIISLIDSDRQWFKARVGMEARQTSRDIAFCSHTITQDHPFVVSDALHDPRFASNPMVVGEPGVRFYAGAPLRTAAGLAVGAICAIDHRPREMEPEKIRHLQDLAEAVVTTLELGRTMRELAWVASTDRLTGLPNRARLIRELETMLTQPPPRSAPFSLLHMDCDDLRAVNDTLGHEAGDLLLRTLARALPGWIRPGDMAARIDGDEFALLLPGADQAAASLVADRVLENSHALMTRHDWAVTLSIGAATFSTPPTTADEALAAADAALSEAKLRGKRRIHALPEPDGGPEAAPLAASLLQRALRGGLSRGELFLHYQPIEPLQPRGEGFVEALVRWNHPTLGVLAPASFIPASERSGLILPLGAEILAMALRRMRQWLDHGVAPARVSVNVSGVQLRNPGFAEDVLAALAAAGVPAGRLELELTEGNLIDGSASVLRALRILAEAGVRLAIDDFGTGYSSLRYLRDLPVHTLKIDRSFIEDIVTNRRDAPIVAAIIAMARTLGLTTVAEGIETPAQRDLLREMGADFGQGWMFGHPADHGPDRPPSPARTSLAAN